MASSFSVLLCPWTAGHGSDEVGRAGAPPLRDSGIDRVHALMTGDLIPLTLAPTGVSPPLNRWLALRWKHILKSANRGIYQILRYLRWSARRWMRWTRKASGFLLFALLTPLLDRDLLRSWRRDGFRAFRVSMALAVAVYVRLLLDRKTPILGKGLLVLAVVYGVAPRDLVPDYLFPTGLIDDLIVVAVASRCFTELCPDRLIESHALQATRGWSRAVRRHAVERQINA